MVELSNQRPTSSGYRFPLFQKRPRSAYHETCVPNEKRSKMPRPERVRPESEFSKCDQVTQDIIWKQAVKKETNGVKSWEENWGFLSEFDGKVTLLKIILLQWCRCERQKNIFSPMFLEKRWVLIFFCRFPEKQR